MSKRRKLATKKDSSRNASSSKVTKKKSSSKKARRVTSEKTHIIPKSEKVHIKIRNLEGKVEKFSENEKKLKLKLKDNNSIISGLSRNIKSLKKGNTNLKAEIIKLNEKFSDFSPDHVKKLEKKIVFLEKELSDLYTDLDTADDEINDYLKERDILLEQNIELARLSTEKEKLLETRNAQFEKLSEDYDKLYSKVVRLEETQSSKKRTRTGKRGRPQIQSLKELNEHLETIEKLRTRLHAKDDEIEELINRLEVQEIKIEELEDEVNANEKARVRLEKAYNRLKTSEPKPV